jgi:hypothetical protein
MRRAPTASPAGSGSERRLPTAATCSLTLRVPYYSSVAAMREALAFAAENCLGFESA